MLERLFTECYFTSALVLELVDRHDSGSCVRKGVEVQVLSRALLVERFGLFQDLV